MICPYCNKDNLSKIESFYCEDKDHRFAYYSTDNFYLHIYDLSCVIQILPSDNRIIVFNNNSSNKRTIKENDYILKIPKCDYTESYKLLLKYLKLIVFI